MSADLSGLQRAAARAGAPDLRPRLVDPPRRRDDWFVVRGDELLVARKVVERCRPDEGEALLVDALLEQRGRRRLRRAAVLAAPVVAAVVAGALAWLAAPWSGIVAGAVLLAALAALAVARAGASLRADDATVALLGAPEPLVRALNAMRHDEIRIGGLALQARPDLHRRAERLSRLHRLCAGPAGESVAAGRTSAAGRAPAGRDLA